MLAANLRRPRGEIDLLVADRSGLRIVVEVKTVTDGDPFLRVDRSKEETLRALCSDVGAGRLDVVGIVVAPRHVTLHAVHGW